ncbi:MAG: potassium uptake protein, TrkH family [Oscillospiraceae bacterium]|nr:potassium uptake protein, TrkH family [Oscillospiraceae bacterium]
MRRNQILNWGNGKIRRLPPAQLIILGFLAIILAGTMLLTLPIASRTHGATDLFTALFTAVSAISVAGLTLVDTYAYWTFFGQAVILLLIQIGGLGFMTIVSIFYFLLHKRMGLRERLVIMESMNLDEMAGVVALVRRVLIATLLFEFVGAVVLSIHFIPEFGWGGGIWRGVFLAVSAFCNAGFHIMGNHDIFSGVVSYSQSPVLLLTMGILIVVGSTGFFVWQDIFTRRRWRKLHVHSKLVVIITAVLIGLGMLMFLGLESSNPNSIGRLSGPERVLVSFFQSISTRTAGFDVIGQFTLAEDTKILSIIFMFIGGSSGSAAGGVKTVTIGILVLSVIAVMRGKHDLVIFERKIAPTQIINAATLVFIAMLLALIGGILLSRTDGVELIDALYETVSAYGTAGMTVGVLEAVGRLEKTLLMLYMFFGKIGVMSLSIAFMMKGPKESGLTYPSEHVIIG